MKKPLVILTATVAAFLFVVPVSFADSPTLSPAAAAESSHNEKAVVRTVTGAKRALKVRISHRVSPAYGVYCINSYAKAYVAAWNELCAGNPSVERLAEYKPLPVTSDDLTPSDAELQKEPYLGYWKEYAPAAAATDFQLAAAKAK